LYMSPEQIRASGEVDARTDVWSLGVVLYELVTGRAPFQGDTITKVCATVLERRAAPLSSALVEVPGGLQEVIDRCMEKDPAARFATVGGLAVALPPLGPNVGRMLTDRISTILRAVGQRVDDPGPASLPPPGVAEVPSAHVPRAPFSTIPGASAPPEA